MVNDEKKTPSAGAADSHLSSQDSCARWSFSTGNLTGDLIRGARTYVVAFAALVLFSQVVLVILEITVQRQGWGTEEYLFRGTLLLVVLGVSAGLIGLLGSPRLSDKGRWFLAAAGFLMFITIGTYFSVRAMDIDSARMIPTWVALMVLAFPLLVPGPNRYHILMALIGAVAIPLAAPLNYLAGGYGEATLYQVMLATLATSLGVWIICGIAIVVAIRTNRLREKLVEKSTELEEAEEQLDTFGSYTLEAMLGKGGMGEVWQARHAFLKRPAAVKLIRTEVIKEQASSVQPSTSIEEILARFEREANATARLTSHNTVQVYDFGRTDSGTFYFVMELLRGMTFDRFVRKFGPLPQERAVYWLKQACASLAEAHEEGLVHRDIKPQNLFVCRAGMRFDVIKVLDFGLVLDWPAAQNSEEAPLTAPNAVAGTPSYMAPEQARNHAVDHRADIYALGCVAYFLLTGTSVFRASTPIDRIIAHIQEAPEPPTQRRPDLEISPQLDQVIMRCLAKDPARRYESVVEVARTLDSLELPRRWNQEKALQWAQRHPDVFTRKSKKKDLSQTPARVRPAHAVFSKAKAYGNGKPPPRDNENDPTKVQPNEES